MEQTNADDSKNNPHIKRTQRQVLDVMTAAGREGLTVAEVMGSESVLAKHHGAVSGALSSLHREGRIVRLTQTRNRCKVYVAPDQVDSRETEQHGRRGAAAHRPRPGRCTTRSVPDTGMTCFQP